MHALMKHELPVIVPKLEFGNQPENFTSFASLAVKYLSFQTFSLVFSALSYLRSPSLSSGKVPSLPFSIAPVAS